MTAESQVVLSQSLPDPAPLAVASRNWTRWVGPGISLLILAAVLYQLRGLDFAGIWKMLPVSIGFWTAFIGYYMAAPVSEWIIFRRLWGLPVQGIAALLRKLVSNEILLGYIGEVYFYAWARRHATITSAPFGAIKDSAILSALAGNVVRRGAARGRLHVRLGRHGVSQPARARACRLARSAPLCRIVE